MRTWRRRRRGAAPALTPSSRRRTCPTRPLGSCWAGGRELDDRSALSRDRSDTLSGRRGRRRVYATRMTTRTEELIRAVPPPAPPNDLEMIQGTQAALELLAGKWN